MYPQVLSTWVLRNLGDVDALPSTRETFSKALNFHLLNRRLFFVHLQHRPVFDALTPPMYKAFSGWVIVFFFVCKLFEKQMINQENGMLTKEATSWTVVATSSAL